MYPYQHTLIKKAFILIETVPKLDLKFLDI